MTPKVTSVIPSMHKLMQITFEIHNGDIFCLSYIYENVSTKYNSFKHPYK